MHSSPYGTLALFVLVVGVDVWVLALDLCLALGGCDTISHHVWRRPWIGVPLVAWQAVGCVWR